MAEQWLTTLRDALDVVEYGVVLLDENLRASFFNQAFRRMWAIPDSTPTESYTFASLMEHGQRLRAYQVAPEQMQAYVDDRIVRVRAGHDGPRQIRVADGRVIKYECLPLTSGARMLTYADQTELVRTVEKLQEIVNIDALTKLNNRRYFYQTGQVELARGARYHHPVSVLMLDIDHFKHVNDTYGHAAGDTVLCNVAHCCRESVRSMDVVGRIGGEEFAVLLPETDLASALIVAEKLRARIAAKQISVGTAHLSATASIGAATVSDEKIDFEDLLRRADESMYRAKAAGRNRVMAL